MRSVASGVARTCLPRLRSAVQQDWSVRRSTRSSGAEQAVRHRPRHRASAIAMEAALKFKEVCGIQAEGLLGRRGQARADGAGRRKAIRCWCSRRAVRRRRAAGAIADDMRRRGARVLLAAPVRARRSSELPIDRQRRRGPRPDHGDPELLPDGRSIGALTRRRPGSSRASLARDHADPMSYRMRLCDSSVRALAAMLPLAALTGMRQHRGRGQGPRRVLDDEPAAEVHRRTSMAARAAVRGRAPGRRARMGRRALGRDADQADRRDRRPLAPALVQLNVPWAYDYSLASARCARSTTLLGEDRAALHRRRHRRPDVQRQALRVSRTTTAST